MLGYAFTSPNLLLTCRVGNAHLTFLLRGGQCPPYVFIKRLVYDPVVGIAFLNLVFDYEIR